LYCAEQQEFFVEHGWLKIPGAIDPKYLNGWMENFWTRLGWDKDDKSTWKETYLKMPRHREVEAYKFCPDAWKAMCEIVGGEENVDEVREYLISVTAVKLTGSLNRLENDIMATNSFATLATKNSNQRRTPVLKTSKAGTPTTTGIECSSTARGTPSPSFIASLISPREAAAPGSAKTVSRGYVNTSYGIRRASTLQCRICTTTSKHAASFLRSLLKLGIPSSPMACYPTLLALTISIMHESSRILI
jgi:hypothetical protein